MSLVVDSSIALSWCFEDERTQAAVDVLRHIEQHGAIAPSLWPLEIQNALLMAERRKRVDQAKRHQLMGLMQALPVMLDTDTASQSWTFTMHLAERFRLTSYDAAYLELAQRRNLPLATLDQELRTAALVLGVSIVGAS